MNLDWTAKQNELRERYADFARTQIAPRSFALGKANKFDQESWQLLLETGFWDLILPEKYSGQSPDWWDFSAALEGIASEAGEGGFLLSIISQAGFIRGLSNLGTEAQQARYFPILQKGGLTSTCIAEPHTGSDTGNLMTEATRSEEKEEDQGSSQRGKWKLSGEKHNIAHAPGSDLLLVVGRIPELGKRDISLFILNRDHTGIVRGKAQEKMGNRTIPTSSLKFEGVEVSEGDILGKPGEGVKSLLEIVVLDRIYYGWMGAMLIKPLLTRVKQFINGRESFHQPLSQHQYVQGKITDVLIGIEQSRWLGVSALHQLLKGDNQALVGSSVAKLAGTSTLEKSARDLMTLLGSEGYLEGEASQLLKDALGFSLVGGTEEMHRINIFNQFIRK